MRKDIQARTPQKLFDFVKLDIEGYELHLLQDTASVNILCRATCIFVELHDWMHVSGLTGIQQAWDAFLAQGCGAEGRFEALPTSGEHEVACKTRLKV